MTVLAGDIGGTKTALALFDKSERGLVLVREDTLPSRGFASLEAAIERFLSAGPRPPSLAAVCLGVAGPVVDGRCVATNLPWIIDERTLAASIPAQRVLLLNDLEVAAHDPRQGVIFYTLDQTPTDAPQFKRDDQCLACHLTWSTRGVPGLFALSMLTLPDDKNSYASGFVSNHTTSFDMRWGGWYVTGNLGSIRHMGNLPVSTTTTPAEPATSKLNSLEGRFDLTGYPTPYSDVAALLVLEHQTHIINLITRLGWEARLEAYEARADAAPIPNASIAAKGKTSRVEVAAADLVDYALFVYETPLPDKIRGSSGFTEKFSALGPADSKGRSLRQLDLGERLMKYPCSYMIYSDAFDALPAVAKDHVYRRLWQVLSGQDKDGRYTVLSTADRRAIVEILRDTKKDLPDYFKAVTK